MRKRIEEIQRELCEAGHDVEWDYLMGALDHTYASDGWEVRVDGELVASALSTGAFEDRLSWWLERVKN